MILVKLGDDDDDNKIELKRVSQMIFHKPANWSIQSAARLFDSSPAENKKQVWREPFSPKPSGSISSLRYASFSGVYSTGWPTV